MFFTTSSTAVIDEAVLHQYEAEEVESGGLPYLQVLTHPNEDIIDTKESRPWGIFLNQENAEAIGFRPDKNWKPVTFYTVEGQGFNQAVLEISERKLKAYQDEGRDIIEHAGYLSSMLMGHLLYQSATEIEKKVEKGGAIYYQFEDLRWKEGEATLAANLLNNRDENDRPTHRWVKRFLLMLVDEDGALLHDKPLQLKAKGGAGGALASELQEFFGDLDKAYGELRGKRVRLSKNRYVGDGRTFVRFGLKFDLFKPGKDSAPYLVPAARIQPVGKQGVTSIKKVTRGKDNERQVDLIPAFIGALMLDRASQAGQTLSTLLAEFERFHLPNQGREPISRDYSPESIAGEHLFTGSIDHAVTPAFKPEGDVIATFDTGEERIQITIPLAHSALLDWALATIKVQENEHGCVVVDAMEKAAPPAQMATVGNLPDF